MKTNYDIFSLLKSPLTLAASVVVISLVFGGGFVRGAMMVAFAMFIGIWFLMTYLMSDRMQRFLICKARWALDIFISVAVMSFSGTGVTSLIAGVYAGLISSIFFSLLAMKYEKDDREKTLLNVEEPTTDH